MFADFRTATSGTGKSFKGALDYFLNDKGEDGARPTTDERVDILELRNLATDNARHAWFEMMNTAQASEALKEAAGVRKGGRVGEKPVFTYHLAWHDSERPDRAEMLSAARSTLKLLGIEHHQAIIVSHSDTAHPHVHVIVNRVNPENGRYAGLSNSWKLLKGWAIEYSKQHGTSWHIPLEQAKDARENRKQTARQAAFNRGAGGRPVPEKQQAAKPKPPTRSEWEARKTAAANEKRAAEAKAAAEIRARLDAKWQAVRVAEKSGYDRRDEEAARFREDRQIARNAIYAKYEEAFKIIWRPEPRQAAPKPTPLSEKTLKLLSSQRRQFERNERSLFGILINARMLAKGQSLMAVAKLALNSTERRRLFDTVQRKAASAARWGKQVERGAAPPKQTKKERSDTLKAMRTRELSQFDRGTQIGRETMAASHSQQLANMRAVKAELSAEGKAAWAAHAAIYRQEQGKDKPAPVQTSAKAAEKPQEVTQDRFGRSRDRKPREPRAPRPEREEKVMPSDQAALPEARPERDDARSMAAKIEARWEAEKREAEKDKDRGEGFER